MFPLKYPIDYKLVHLWSIEYQPPYTNAPNQVIFFTIINVKIKQ